MLPIFLLFLFLTTLTYAATSIELTTGNFINVFGNLNLSGNNLINAGNVSIKGNLSVDGNVSLDGSTLFVDATSNNVGIGTTAPNTKLEVNVSSGTVGIATNGSVGIGTTSPAQNVAGSTGDISGRSAHIYNSGGISSVIVEGSGTSLWSIDLGGGTDAKILDFRVDDGVGTFRSWKDDLSGLNKDNILVMNLSSGNVGIGTTTPNYLLQTASGTDGRSVNLSNVLYVNGTNGSVGIGTNLIPPAVGRLHVRQAGSTSIGTNNQIVIAEDANTGSALSQLGLGAVQTGTQVYTPSVIGQISTSATGFTKGDIFFATRDVTTDTQPTERMRITSAGNVGIGTTGPAYSLHVNATTNQFGITNGNTGAALTDGFGIAVIASQEVQLIQKENANMTFYTNDTERIRITNTGNVGIGTASPLQLLHISNPAVDGILWLAMSNDARRWLVGVRGDQSDNFVISDDTAQQGRLTINAAGNVGIGTTGPTARFVVVDTTAGNNDIFLINGSTGGDGGKTGFRNLAVGGAVDRPGLLLGAGGDETYSRIWVDDSRNLRIMNTGDPTDHVDGTVVGTQTSVRETKQDISDYTDYASALRLILEAPLHKFRYQNEVRGYGKDHPLTKYRIGFIADEVNPQFIWGNAIDQVSVNGLLMASIKEQQEQIDGLKTGKPKEAQQILNRVAEVNGSVIIRLG